MVSPACLNKVLGLGGAGGAGGATGSWTAMGVGSTLTGARRVLIRTGSTGAGAGAGLGAGSGGGSTVSLIGRGSSMILRFLGAESSAPLGLPLPRFGTANSWICSEFLGLLANSRNSPERPSFIGHKKNTLSDGERKTNVWQPGQN